MQYSNILPINSLLTKINTIFEKIQIKNNNQYWNQLVLLNNILRKHYLVYSKQIGQLAYLQWRQVICSYMKNRPDFNIVFTN